MQNLNSKYTHVHVDCEPVKTMNSARVQMCPRSNLGSFLDVLGLDWWRVRFVEECGEEWQKELES